jgi:hypothetical protein
MTRYDYLISASNMASKAARSDTVHRAFSVVHALRFKWKKNLYPAFTPLGVMPPALFVILTSLLKTGLRIVATHGIRLV